MTLDLGGEGCRSELVARGRRGPLNGADHLALEAHLERCAACRLARDVGRAFDDHDAVDVRDGARIQALVEAARGGRRSAAGTGGSLSERSEGVRTSRSTGRVRARAIAAAAALVVCGGSASAAVWLWRRPGAAVAARVASARPPSIDAVERDRLRSTAAAAPAPLAFAVEASPPPARVELPARTTPPPTAAMLLGQATDARRDGEVDRAAALYRRLQRAFPSSPEAMLSRVSLGRILLDGGAPTAALAQFDGYLSNPRRGTLLPEALYGRARALARIGDRPAERETWRRLVADFPDSVYAPLGQRRLAEPE